MVTHTRNLCSAFNPSKVHTHTAVNTHTVNTHPEQWAAIYAGSSIVSLSLKKTQFVPKYLFNYGPISNLPFLSKILEKVVSSQLCSFLEKSATCEDFQSGFRPYHSTETALNRVTNDLLLSSYRGSISLLVILDLSAAFDTIDHNILLNRLENYIGIRGSALPWFKSYLSDRHQFVAVNEEVSY